MRVHLKDRPDDSDADVLAGLAASGIWVTVGQDAPPDTEVLVWGVPDSETLDRLANLKAVVVPWAGVPDSTRKLVSERPHLRLFNLHHHAVATAEMAFALLMAVAKRIVPNDRELRAGRWGARYDPRASLGLAGRTAVILGYGAIGRHVGVLCRAAQMRVVGIRTKPGPAEDGVEVRGIAELDSLLPSAEALIVCAPQTAATCGLIDARRLALLPADAMVVNVGRGPIVDEDALFDALACGRLFGAGIDVWYRYPADGSDTAMPANRPFHELPNVVMSPHHGGNVVGIERDRMRHLARLLETLARGDEPAESVDPHRGY